MYYQLEATKNFCANVGPRNKKRFLNPPMGDMLITEENGRVTIGASMASQKGHYVLPQRVALESNALL